MACMEHTCTQCGETWFDNKPNGFCTSCGSTNTIDIFDEETNIDKTPTADELPDDDYWGYSSEDY